MLNVVKEHDFGVQGLLKLSEVWHIGKNVLPENKPVQRAVRSEACLFITAAMVSKTVMTEFDGELANVSFVIVIVEGSPPSLPAAWKEKFHGTGQGFQEKGVD